jgi:hypothetical protein
VATEWLGKQPFTEKTRVKADWTFNDLLFPHIGQKPVAKLTALEILGEPRLEHLVPLSTQAVTAALRRMGYDGETMTWHGFRSMASTTDAFSPDPFPLYRRCRAEELSRFSNGLITPVHGFQR